MAESTLWWIATGLAVAVELTTLPIWLPKPGVLVFNLNHFRWEGSVLKHCVFEDFEDY